MFNVGGFEGAESSETFFSRKARVKFGVMTVKDLSSFNQRKGKKVFEILQSSSKEKYNPLGVQGMNTFGKVDLNTFYDLAKKR